MNKKPLSVIDLHSLITSMLMASPRCDTDLTDGVQVQVPEGGLMSVVKIEVINVFRISTRLEQCRSRQCNTANCETLNYGISCGNTESLSPTRSFKYLYEPCQGT